MQNTQNAKRDLSRLSGLGDLYELLYIQRQFRTGDFCIYR